MTAVFMLTIGLILFAIAIGLLWFAIWIWTYTPTFADLEDWERRRKKAELVKFLNRKYDEK